MSRIAQTFTDLRLKGQKALIPYFCCGDPSLEFTEQLVLKLAECGADLVELGVPFSDPAADGPTIQKASQRALAGGITLEKVLQLAARLRSRTEIPLILMSYYNPIYRFGLERFVSRAKEAGIDGLIVPDLPPEETGILQESTDPAEIDLILLAAPTSTAERMKRIAALARGFIYCVSVTGVTGSREKLASGLEAFLAQMRSHTDLPLAVGFGIKSPETAGQAAAVADGVVTGSSLIERIEEALHLVKDEPERVINEVCDHFASLKKAI